MSATFHGRQKPSMLCQSWRLGRFDHIVVVITFVDHNMDVFGPVYPWITMTIIFVELWARDLLILTQRPKNNMFPERRLKWYIDCPILQCRPTPAEIWIFTGSNTPVAKLIDIQGENMRNGDKFPPIQVLREELHKLPFLLIQKRLTTYSVRSYEEQRSTSARILSNISSQ